jgi:hypothetical protein
MRAAQRTDSHPHLVDHLYDALRIDDCHCVVLDVNSLQVILSEVTTSLSCLQLLKPVSLTVNDRLQLQ